MIPEERAFSIMAHVIERGGRDMETIAQAICEAIAEEREACAQIVDNQLSYYPGDVFVEPPPGKHGTTVDACSARALRDILPVIAVRIRARANTEMT